MTRGYTNSRIFHLLMQPWQRECWSILTRSWEKTEPRQLTQIKLDRVGWWGTAMLREWLGIDVWLSNCTVLFFFFSYIYIYIFSPSFSVLLNCLYLVLQILFLFPIFSPIPQRVRESANDCLMLSFLLG